MSKKVEQQVEVDPNTNKQVRWEPEAVIEITGGEFYYLNQIAQMFGPTVAICNDVMARMIKSGIAKPATTEQDVKKTVEDVIQEAEKATEKSKKGKSELQKHLEKTPDEVYIDNTKLFEIVK